MGNPALARADDLGRRTLRGLRGTLLDRWWAQIDRSGGPEACWPWMGSRSTRGYGVLGDGKASQVYAHRVALELRLGRALQPGYLACHTCDNKGCANPFHMFEGTDRDNIGDSVTKGRHSSQVPGRRGLDGRFL